MADLSITAGSVLAGGGSTKRAGTAGATITAGQVVYLDTSDGRYKLADADSGTAAVRSPFGIALNGASAGQPLTVCTRGAVTIGATVTAGTTYYLSPNPGGIAPLADLLSGDYPTIVGIATSTSVIDVQFIESGVAL